MQVALAYKTWYELLFKERNILVDIALVVFSVVFLAILSNLYIPLWPVPITGQTFGLFIIAFFFGSKRGFLSILTYLIAGALGFGVFAQFKSGLATFIGPTAGYLIGFLAMVFIIGLMIEKGYGRTKRSVLVCMLVGEAVLYLFGLTWLWMYLGYPGFITLLSAGFFPFLIGDALKIGAAIALFPKVWGMGKKVNV